MFTNRASFTLVSDSMQDQAQSPSLALEEYYFLGYLALCNPGCTTVTVERRALQSSGSDRRFLDPSPARSPGPVSAQCHVGSTQAPLAFKFLPLAALLSDRNHLLHHRCRHVLIRRREHKHTHSLAQSCIWTFFPAKTPTEQQLKTYLSIPPSNRLRSNPQSPTTCAVRGLPSACHWHIHTFNPLFFSKVLCLVTTY